MARWTDDKYVSWVPGATLAKRGIMRIRMDIFDIFFPSVWFSLQSKNKRAELSHRLYSLSFQKMKEGAGSPSTSRVLIPSHMNLVEFLAGPNSTKNQMRINFLDHESQVRYQNPPGDDGNPHSLAKPCNPAPKKPQSHFPILLVVMIR